MIGRCGHVVPDYMMRDSDLCNFLLADEPIPTSAFCRPTVFPQTQARENDANGFTIGPSRLFSFLVLCTRVWVVALLAEKRVRPCRQYAMLEHGYPR